MSTAPPFKSQGIKTKLVPWINDLILISGTDLDALVFNFDIHEKVEAEPVRQLELFAEEV